MVTFGDSTVSCFPKDLPLQFKNVVWKMLSERKSLIGLHISESLCLLLACLLSVQCSVLHCWGSGRVASAFAGEKHLHLRKRLDARLTPLWEHF